MKLRITSNDIMVMVTYGFANVLFAYKYAMRFTTNPTLWILGYVVFLIALLVLLYSDIALKSSVLERDAFFAVCVLGIALVLYFAMSRFEPSHIRVGRFPALYDWISRLLHGQFPYLSPTRPSGFPFLFVLAMPFYLLGDLGLMQVFAFLLYAFLVHTHYAKQGANRYRVLILLACAPMFLYEIVVRSDLFSNMVIVMVFMFVLEGKLRRANNVMLVVAGFVAGLLLSTRGIVLLIFILYFGYFFRHSLRKGLVMLVGISAGFLITILPFVLWDPARFVTSGPLAIQSSYLPLSLLICSIVLCLLLAIRAKALSSVYKYIAVVLFAVVSVAFCLSILSYGWSATIFKDRFDISYFCLSLPFLLLLPAFGRPHNIDAGRQTITPDNSLPH